MDAPQNSIKRRFRFGWVLAILVLTALAGVIYFTLRPKPVAVSVRQVERGTVERTVTILLPVEVRKMLLWVMVSGVP